MLKDENKSAWKAFLKGEGLFSLLSTESPKAKMARLTLSEQPNFIVKCERLDCLKRQGKERSGNR